MEYVVLGLLMLRSFTLYDLNKAFEQGVSLFYSASYGSLQFAVKKLLQGGYIAVEERQENGRNKKIYSITENGRTLFLDWMRDGELTSNKLETVALTKLYFLGIMEQRADKRLILQRIIEAIRRSEEELVQLDKQLSQQEVPAPYREIGRYQMKCLDYGIQTYRFSRTWFEAALEELDSSPE